MVEFKYKGRKVTVAKLAKNAGYAYRIVGRKGEKTQADFCRAWTAKRGAKRAIDRQEA